MTTVGSLCSGYEGIGLALGTIFDDLVLAWVSDNHPDAQTVLAHHHPGVPNLDDLTTVDWHNVESVDILTAGYPCQPFSHAGKRKGTNDERHLWPHISDAIGVLRPRLVLLENVAGHLSLGGPAVVADLARRGYDARWLVVRASDIGACHRRARWFCAAVPHADDDGGGGRQPEQGRGTLARTAARRPSQDVPADADDRRREQRDESERRLPITSAFGGDAATDTDGTGRRLEREQARLASVADGRDLPRTDWADYGPAIARHERLVGRAAPSPVDHKHRLSPLFVEWMMCLPEGHVTDIITRRTSALRLLGNGVVPPQAAYAYRQLLASF